MENKLDILTQKLYNEGVDKARQEAENIINQAKQEAEKIIADAKAKVAQMNADAETEVSNLKKKAESEMTLSARQAITALKQAITKLVAGDVAGDIAKIGFEEKAFIQELLMTIVKKWDVAGGNLNMEILLSENEKATFESFVAAKYKDLLDKGLDVKVGNLEEGFVIQPKDGGFQIAFSEKLFEAFFNQYMKGFTKKLLFEGNK